MNDDNISNKGGNKLRTYKLFKNSFKIESYLKIIGCPKTRSVLTRFRISNHNLSIETGRHKNTPINARICLQCNNAEVEDEKHFMIDCMEYNIYRRKLFSEIQILSNKFTNMNTIEKFTFLMRSENPKIILLVANYIKLSFEHRNKVLFES